MTLEPPASIAELADEQRGTFAVLLLPWGEAADVEHPLQGRSYSRGEAHQPKVPERCRVGFEHDSPEQVGAIVSTATDEVGLWGVLKLGFRGRQWLERGYRSVSVELDARGGLEGVALLAGHHVPAFESAQFVVDATPAWSASPERLGLLEQVVALADVSGGTVLVDPQPVPKPAGWDLSGPPLLLDGGRARQEAYAVSISAVADDVAHDQAMYEQRMAAFREVEAEHEELMLTASGTPTHLWPKHTTKYRQWKALVDQQAAEREAERQRVEAAGIRELVESWHARELVVTEPKERSRSWLTRTLRRLSFRRSALSASTTAVR